MDGSAAQVVPPSGRRWYRPVVVVLLVIAAGVWWWWPSLARDPGRLDVLVVGDGEVSESAQAIGRRIREEGMSVTIVPFDPCSDPARLETEVLDRSPAVVVVSSRRRCDDWITVIDAGRRGDDRRVIALAQSGRLDATARAVLDDLGVTLADPERLLGPADAMRAGCLWWDDCDPDGTVAVRRGNGSLTPAGAERVARVLTGNIP